MANLWLALLGGTWVAYADGDLQSPVFTGDFGPESTMGVHLRTLSWNVAAVNNNPFEYWITHPNPAYKALMQDVERFILSPGEEDVRVDQLFTHAMFEKVYAKMEELGFEKLETVKRLWESDYRSRKVVSQFLQDATIGKKRLASMPDRVTNTIQLSSGKAAFRPTVINCYEEDLGSLDHWFVKWFSFFFEDAVDLGKGPKPIYSLLQKIKQAKYPDITLEEEAASIPLQLVLSGVFDAILINLMHTKGGDFWQNLRKEICVSLNSQKSERIVEILRTTYHDADIIFLQEAGNKMVEFLKKDFAEVYDVITPRQYDMKRNQNSVILLRKHLFRATEEVEVPTRGWEAGDLLLLKTQLGDTELTLASFHGDTNGLLTMPMLEQVHEHLSGENLLFGMDANTYEKQSKSTAHVLEFEELYQKLGYKSCWGKVEPSRYTTFNARTYLQPQLNKAARSTALKEKGDQNPKDFVLFSNNFVGGQVWRDNTGRAVYLEDTVFPTLDFPSDHAAIAVDILLRTGRSQEL
eukprot:TRINITY_DN20944_c0_g1_i1.p1 TRINITY_DN20944_c0_g1~~TRINITY_DN20944_c0_g1_i1.p1  ORF type:complete len:522 (+),score=79.69 TRINITY_DN20944_c0_g1_i1:71-1636(+)